MNRLKRALRAFWREWRRTDKGKATTLKFEVQWDGEWKAIPKGVPIE